MHFGQSGTTRAISCANYNTLN